MGVDMENEGFNFENLNVYQKALGFVDSVYTTTGSFPKEERFALIDQFRRAAISIVLNIAEGYGASKLEFKRYLKIAKGSNRECVAIITLSRMRNYIDKDAETSLRSKTIELSKMLSGLINSIK